MADYREHIRAGVQWYAAFLVIGLALWAFRSALPVDAAEFLIPISADFINSVFAIGLCFVIAVLSSLFPDIDTKSKGQLLFYRLFLATDFALILLFYLKNDKRFLEGAAFLGLAAMFPLIGKHRGWTHARISALILPAPLLFVPMAIQSKVVWDGLPYFLAAFFGYASHLSQDGILFGQRAVKQRGPVSTARFPLSEPESTRRP